MRIFGKILLWFMALLGVPMLLMIIFAITLAFNMQGKVASIEPNTVLWLDLENSIPERVGSTHFFEQYDQVGFLDYLQAIERAKTDDRVVAIAAKINNGNMGVAQIQGLRDALIDFGTESGKSTYAYAQDLGALGGGMLGYYLATGFSEIWLSPTGGVGVSGMAMEIPYFAEALEKLDIKAEMGQRHEYKMGADSFMQRNMSDAVRNSLQNLLNGWQGQIIAGMKRNRQNLSTNFTQLIDNSPYLPQQSLELGLVDRLAYWDEFTALIEGLSGDTKSHIVSVAHYMSATNRESEKADGENTKSRKVAVIQGIGPISQQDYGPGFYTDETFAPYTVTKALADARQDQDIDAILFRVSSPGGAFTQSDMVRREVMKVKQAGLPIIVSMGDIAASGGYFVSMGADHIVAQPGTLTGSIGVYAGKIAATQRFWDKLGVSWGRIETGPQAGMWRMVSEFTPSQKAKFQQGLDFVYKDFTTKVAKDRGLDPAQVDAVARGRVWTGEEAIGVRLVDAPGGYKAALEALRIALETEEDAPLTLEVFPKQPSALEQLQTIFSADNPWRYLSVKVGLPLLEKQIPDQILKIRDQFAWHGLLTMPPIQLQD